MIFNKNTVFTAFLAASLAMTSSASTCRDVTGWYDMDGPDFDCEWYANTPYGCEMYGADRAYENFGLVANEACCACGGGDRSTISTTPTTVASAATMCDVSIWEASMALTTAVNNHRVNNGMPALPVSIGLIATAQAHVTNLEGTTSSIPQSCNMHSWLNDIEGDRFDSCCYTSSHSNANCMWKKPGQITADWSPNTNGCNAMNAAYKHNGYEISYKTSGVVTVEGAIAGWQGSSGHRNVMLSAAGWEAVTKTIGCAMGTNYAHCWFAAEDPNTPVVF